MRNYLFLIILTKYFKKRKKGKVPYFFLQKVSIMFVS